MLKHPESVHCPACGSPDYLTLHSELSTTLEIRLVSLRRCMECDATYYPPTPRWVSIAAVLLGLFVVVGGIYLARVVPSFFDPEETAARYATSAFFYFLAVVGCGFVLKGSLRWIMPSKLDTVPLAEGSQIYFEGEAREENRIEGIEPPP